MPFYGFRYYAPELGRWPSRDPMGERGGVNLFVMVGNDLLNRLDPIGLREANIQSDHSRYRSYRPKLRDILNRIDEPVPLDKACRAGEVVVRTTACINIEDEYDVAYRRASMYYKIIHGLAPSAFSQFEAVENQVDLFFDAVFSGTVSHLSTIGWNVVTGLLVSPSHPAPRALSTVTTHISLAEYHAQTETSTHPGDIAFARADIHEGLAHQYAVTAALLFEEIESFKKLYDPEADIMFNKQLEWWWNCCCKKGAP